MGSVGSQPVARLRTEIPLGTGRAVVVSTTRADGSFALDEPADALAARRSAIHPAPWTWLRQVHGARVVDVAAPGDAAGSEADAAVTTAVDAPVAVLTADCVPVVLVAEGGIATVHAGWRGAAEGVVQAAARRLSSVAGSPVAALVGPHIGPGRYEFGEADLASLVRRFGSTVEGRTDDGLPALRVRALVEAALSEVGWVEPTPLGGRWRCTGDEAFHSHRVRGDRGRQTTVAWLETT